MSSKAIRVLVVDADPGEGGALPARLAQQVLRNEGVAGVEIVGLAGNRREAIRQAGALEPDVLLVDLMLPGYRSIDIIRRVAGAQPEIRALAVTPADPPHDRIMLAAEAGALGYVCRDAAPSEFGAAIEQVHRGEPWLPLHQTYEVLQDGASELAVSAEERRSRLTQVVLGIIPLTGVVAAITAFLWRTYWGGNADLYVLYDPCSETVRFVPVGSSRVELIDQVTCRSP